MAWNGGVSLAVWMGGAAVELDAARRARPAQTLEESEQRPGATARSACTSADVYKAICLAFDRRLVIDILAGASAGGLNGCLLAGSIIFDRPLTTGFLRDKWIVIGDFSSLLQPLSLEKPASIMQGSQFYTVVRAAFDELLGNDLPSETLDEVPVFLDVQVTNVVMPPSTSSRLSGARFRTVCVDRVSFLLVCFFIGLLLARTGVDCAPAT